MVSLGVRSAPSFIENGPTFFMPQAMAGSTQRDQIFGFVSAPMMPRDFVVHFQEPCSTATRCLTAMLVPGQNLPSHPRWNGGCIAAAGAADSGIAAHAIGFGGTQIACPCVSLDGHPVPVVVHMDLDRGPVREGPRGAFSLVSIRAASASSISSARSWGTSPSL